MRLFLSVGHIAVNVFLVQINTISTAWTSSMSATCRANSASQAPQDGGLVAFEGTLLEVRRSHVTAVIDAEHADDMDDTGAGA